MINRRVDFAMLFAAAVVTAGCSRMQSNGLNDSGRAPQNQNFSSPDLAPNGDSTLLPPKSRSGLHFPKVNLCSGLDFTGVTWPAALTSNEQTALALALNVSSGFEGSEGWATLTNSFDGQGLSMGLLNQNLGQGTLEPMWVDMHSQSAPEMRRAFSTKNLTSLTAMLSQWKGIVIPATINLADYGYSAMDDLNLVATEMEVDPAELEIIQTALISRNQVAVDWARSTLYRGSTFKSDWSTQLKALAVTPAYRSLQIAEGAKIHRAALELLSAFKLHELRSYLFFYDVAVQNGGISATIRRDFSTWLKSNLRASEGDKLNQILALRLRTVSSRFARDVRLRKSALIKGSGIVHGQGYDFEKEYCVSLSTIILP